MPVITRSQYITNSTTNSTTNSICGRTDLEKWFFGRISSLIQKANNTIYVEDRARLITETYEIINTYFYSVKIPDKLMVIIKKKGESILTEMKDTPFLNNIETILDETINITLDLIKKYEEKHPIQEEYQVQEEEGSRRSQRLASKPVFDYTVYF